VAIKLSFGGGGCRHCVFPQLQNIGHCMNERRCATLPGRNSRVHPASFVSGESAKTYREGKTRRDKALDASQHRRQAAGHALVLNRRLEVGCCLQRGQTRAEPSWEGASTGVNRPAACTFGWVPKPRVLACMAGATPSVFKFALCASSSGSRFAERLVSPSTDACQASEGNDEDATD
jgi:hypothetical protein